MAKEQPSGIRIRKAATELGVGVDTLIEFLNRTGSKVEGGPNGKITAEDYSRAQAEFGHKPAVSAAPDKVEESPREVTTVADALGISNEPVPTPEVVETAPPEAPTLNLTLKGKVELPAEDPEVVAEREEQARKEAARAERIAREKAEAARLKAEKERQEAERIERAKAAEAERARQEAERIAKEKEDNAAVEAAMAAAKLEAEKRTRQLLEEQKAEEQAKREAERKAAMPEPFRPEVQKLEGTKVIGKIDLSATTRSGRQRTRKPIRSASPDGTTSEPIAPRKDAQQATQDSATPEPVTPFRTEVQKLEGTKVVGKIDLTTLNDRTRRRPEASATPGGSVQKRRKKTAQGGPTATGTGQQSGQQPSGQGGGGSHPHGKGQKGPQRRQNQYQQQNQPPKPAAPERTEISMEDVEEKIRQTKARLASKRNAAVTRGAKYRKERHEAIAAMREQQAEADEANSRNLTIAEFTSVSELASMMGQTVTSVITTCMNMGLMVTINQRLDAESLRAIVSEYDYSVDFVEAEIEVADAQLEDKEEDLVPRPPIFTVLGHVDHGKTTLCDKIRKTNVTAEETGGITQHLSAYSFTLPNGRQLTLIDTPGHEAFSAMRARGAKLTDVAIIVVSAEDGIMPQTEEAISHASMQGAHIVFAINKMDSPKADLDRVKKELADKNYLIEEWGGKYQSQDISAKFNTNIDLLLEKVLLEADVMDLKANPNRRAEATVLESSIDKGRGHVATVLVHRGTLKKGDCIVSGGFYGRVKAMFNDLGKEVTAAGPSMPVLVVGLNGAPSAGTGFSAVATDKEARTIANKVSSIQRVSALRTRKHITLDEIGRRIAIGHFQELNLVVKADVDGSFQAITGSLMELSTPEIQVNVIGGGVGQITEGDVSMAAASNAIIIGFQVRPSQAARKLADLEQIDIRLYSIIFEVVDEVKSAMEGMLTPELKEEITGTAEVLETFKISKVGTIAGSMVREGKIQKGNKVRIIRDGIVVYTGELSSLKRFKDEVKEVSSGQDCGLCIKNYNGVEVGDFIESFKETEVRRTL